jgi:esterase/lipase
MGDLEVGINGKTIGENTQISLSVKTALWIISGTIALFTTLLTLAYFDIKSEVQDYKDKVEQEKKEYLQKVEDQLNQNWDKTRDKNEEIQKDVDEIKGNVKVILDRTAGVRNIEGAPTINNNTPPPGR